MTHTIDLDGNLVPGDMVRITAGDGVDGVWAQVEVGSTEAEKPSTWIPAAPDSVAMYLGDATELVLLVPSDRLGKNHQFAQVLHEGRILNILTKYLRPER